MLMRDPRRATCLLNEAREVVSKECTNRRHTRSAVIAIGTLLAKQAAGSLLPRRTSANTLNKRTNRTTVAARVLIMLDETGRKGIRLNGVVLAQYRETRK